MDVALALVVSAPCVVLLGRVGCDEVLAIEPGGKMPDRELVLAELISLSPAAGMRVRAGARDCDKFSLSIMYEKQTIAGTGKRILK